MKRAASARGKRDDIVAGAPSPSKRLARAPVIGDLVIVPLREHRHLGIECPHISVEQIVFVIAAKVRERARNLGLLLGDQVPPHRSVRKLALRRDRTIGVDVVAAMDEEIGPSFQHGRIGAHAAARFIDAPTAAGGIARPDEGHAAPFPWRGTKVPDVLLAEDRERKILEANAIEYVLSGRQALDQRLGREIRLRQRIHGGGAQDISEAVAGGDLDQHARRPIGARPHDTGIDRRITRLDAVRDERAIGRPAEIGSCHAANGSDRRSRSRQEPAPRERRGAAARDDGHWASAVESTRRKLPASSDRDPTF